MLRRLQTLQLALVCLVLVAAALRGWYWWHTTQMEQLCIAPQALQLRLRISQVTPVQAGALSVLATIQNPVVIGCVQGPGRTLKLFYMGEQALSAGDQVTALVKLKPIHGTHNPNLFRYDVWAKAKGYLAAGHIKKILALERVAVSRPTIPILLHAGVLQALSNGDRTQISQTQWNLFRQTGTVHLVVISGLHVSIYAGLSAGLCLFLLRCLTWSGFLTEALTSRIGLFKVGLLCAFVSVWLLVWVSGAQPPVLRAALMTSIGITLLLLHRKLKHRIYLWLLACTVLVLIQPGYLVLSGFWLSFVAVLILILTLTEGIRGNNLPRNCLLFVRIQFALFVGMAAWVMQASGEMTLLAPLANLLAVPLVTLVTMPLVVLAQVLGWIEHLAGWTGQTLGLLVWHLADFSVWCLQQWLQSTVLFWPQAVISTGHPTVTQFLVLAVVGLLLQLPLSLGARGLLVVLFVTQLLQGRSVPPASGQFYIHQFDVGQGGAAMVTTRHHRLLIDAGPAYRYGQDSDGETEGFDSGRSIVWPSILGVGPPWPESIVITHMDQDHAGGLSALQSRLKLSRVIVEDNCVHGSKWIWDDVQFTLLRDTAGNNRNDASCTLLVQAESATAYFSGDISRRAEQRLLPQLPRKIDVLLSPHHGSASSSSWAFIAHLQPRLVIHSAGQMNRYGHPRADVIARYTVAGALNLVTAQTGAVTWDSSRSNRVWLSRLGQWQSVPHR